LVASVVCLLACERRTATPSGTAAGPATASIAPPPDASAPVVGSASAGASDASAEPPFVGTAAITQKKKPFDRSLVQDDVRAARHAGYDRIVFQFEAGVPGYHLEYVDRPVLRCGSGEPVTIAGDGWLRVRLEPAAAHDDQGRATIAERDRKRKIELGVLRELVLTCDFEGQVIWVLGVAAPNRYRVLELDGPPRLVVDVRHR